MESSESVESIGCQIEKEKEESDSSSMNRTSFVATLTALRGKKRFKWPGKDLGSPGGDAGVLLDSLLHKGTDELSVADLRHLEAEFEAWQDRTEMMKRKLQQHQEYHKIKQTGQLREEMESLDSRVEHERTEREKLENQLQALRKIEAEVALEGDEFDEQVQKLELEHQLEQVALLRIKADRIRAQRDEIERLELQSKAEIEAIVEENDRRKASSSKQLKKLLSKVDALATQLQDAELQQNEKDQKFVLDDDNAEENEIEFARLFDKVTSLREEKWEARLQALEKELGMLCEERQKLLKEEEELDEKRRRHEKLVSKGLDFLVELELGNVPPEDFLFKNDDDTEQISYPLNQDDEILSLGEVEDKIELMEEKIDRMTLEREDTEKEYIGPEKSSYFPESTMVPYDGSLGPESYSISQLEAFREASAILLAIIDDFFENYHDNPEGMKKHAVESLENWEASTAVLERRLDHQGHENAIRIVSDEMIQRTLIAVIRGIYGEAETATELSKKIANKLIISSVFSVYGSIDTVSQEMCDEVSRTLDQFQKTRIEGLSMSAIESRIPPTRLTLKLEPPSVGSGTTDAFYAQNTAYSSQSISRIRDQLEKRQQGCDNLVGNIFKDSSRDVEERQGRGQDPDDDDDDEDDNDLITVIKFGVTKPASLEYLSEMAPEYRKLEKDFWNNISFRSKHIYLGRASGYASALKSSSAGDFLAVGMSTGSLFIFDLRPRKQCRLLRSFELQKKEKKSPIAQIAWPIDRGSMIVTLDEAGLVRLFSTDASLESSKVGKSFQRKFCPRPLNVILILSWENFDRPVQEDLYERLVEGNMKKKRKKIRSKKKQGTQEDLIPRSVQFHSAHTLFGLQRSILIGLTNGDIVKWNVDAETKFGDRPVFCPSHARNEPPNPRKPEFVPGDPRKRGRLFGSTIKREFFQDHKAEPVFMGFVNRSSELLYSLDKSMQLCLWPYEPGQFSGFGWFLPLYRFALDLRSIAFRADNEKEIEQEFPPEHVAIPSEQGFEGSIPRKKRRLEDDILKENPDFLKLAEDEEALIQALPLQEKPWLLRVLEDEQERTMEIYAPDEFPFDDSSPHQIIVRSNGGIILKRMLSYFKPDVYDGVLEDVTLSNSGTEIFFLVFYKASREKPAIVKIFIYDATGMDAEPSCHEIVFEGTIRPRFAVSPLMREIGSDYVYLLMNSCIYVVSLTTGLFVTKKLNPLGRNAPIDASLTDVDLTRDHEHLACIGPGNDTVFLFAIDNRNPTNELTEQELEQLFRPRMNFTPREYDI